MNDIPLMPTEGALGAAAVAHRAVRRKMGADGMFLTDKRTLQFEFAVCPRVLQCASATVMEVPLQMAADVTVLEAMMDGDGANNAGSAGDGHGRPRDAKVSPPKDVIVDAFAMRVSPDLLSEGTGSATAKPKRTQPQQQTKTWRDRIIGYTASQSAHRAQLHDSRKLHGQLQEAADAEARSIISFAVAKHFPGYKVRAIKCKVEPVSNEKGVRVDQSDCASVTRLHYPMWVAESSLEGDDDPRRRFHTAVDGIYGVCLGQRPRPLLMLPWFGAGTAFALPTGCFLIDPTLAAFQTLSTAIDALANASSPVLIMMALFTAVPPFLARTTNRFVFERVVADDLAQRRALVPERRDAASLGVDLVRNLTFEAERAGERAVDKVAQRIREALVGKE